MLDLVSRTTNVNVIHQSIPSANTPPAHPTGNFFEVVKSPAPGQNFCAKAGPPGQKSTYARGISCQPFLLIGVEILEFCRNQTLKRTEMLSNYSLVIPSSFSLSTILYHSRVFPSFEADFLTRKQKLMIDQFKAGKCLHAASTDNLVLIDMR